MKSLKPNYSNKEQELIVLFKRVGNDTLQKKSNIPQLISLLNPSDNRLNCLILEILTRWEDQANQISIELDPIINLTNGDMLVYHQMEFLTGYNSRTCEESEKILRIILDQAIEKTQKNSASFEIWSTDQNKNITIVSRSGSPIAFIIMGALKVQFSKIKSANEYLVIFKNDELKEKIKKLITTIYGLRRLGFEQLLYISVCLEFLGKSGEPLAESLNDNLFHQTSEELLYDIISTIGRHAPSIFQGRNLLQILHDQFINQPRLRPKILEVIGEIGQAHFDLIRPKFDWLIHLTANEIEPPESSPAEISGVRKFYETLAKIGVQPDFKQELISKFRATFTEWCAYPKVLQYFRENYELFKEILSEQELTERIFGLIGIDFDPHSTSPKESKIELKNWIVFLAQRQPPVLTNTHIKVLYSLKEGGRLDLNLDELIQGYNHQIVNQICSILDSLNTVSLEAFYVVPGYIKYDEPERNRLTTLYTTIAESLERPTGNRENYLIWGRPGSGKTFLIEQFANALESAAVYRSLDLANSNQQVFSARLQEIENELESKNVLSLIDEIDSKADENWPFEILKPFLDINRKKAHTLICVLIGSSGKSVQELQDYLSKLHKGSDIISRIQNFLEINPPTTHDNILLIIELIKKITREREKPICSIEKFAIIYLSQVSEFGNPRQMEEFLKHAIQRIDRNETRLHYDDFFPSGDSKRYRFWYHFKEEYNRYENQFISF